MDYNQRRNSWAAALGGLSGGIFLLGLALAIISGHFLPVFFITLGVTSFVGALAGGNAHSAYGGFQGAAFLCGLAFCFIFGWWPWFLVVLAVSTILGSLHVPVTAALQGAFNRPYAAPVAPPVQPYQPHQPYTEGYQPQQPAATYQEGGQQHSYEPETSPSNYSEQPQAQYPQQMPPMQQ